MTLTPGIPSRDTQHLADQAAEGRRFFYAGQDAEVSYEIARLPENQCAVRMHCAYKCGDRHSVVIPWRVFNSPEECLSFFLQEARKHFAHHVFSSSAEQK